MSTAPGPGATMGPAALTRAAREAAQAAAREAATEKAQRARLVQSARPALEWLTKHSARYEFAPDAERGVVYRPRGSAKLTDAERERMRAERQAIGAGALSLAWRLRSQAESAFEATRGPWLGELARVAHELSESEATRARSILGRARDAIGRADVDAARQLGEAWVWAAHPIRWLPHGAIVGPGTGREWIGRIYLEEWRDRFDEHSRDGRKWSMPCRGEGPGACRGGCCPPGLRLWVVPQGWTAEQGDPEPRLWDGLWCEESEGEWRERMAGLSWSQQAATRMQRMGLGVGGVGGGDGDGAGGGGKRA